jgi:hypothetical protein
MACRAARQAKIDEMATIDGRTGFSLPPFGPLGRRYAEVTDRLSALMRSDDPDLRQIEKLWLEADRLKLTLRSNSVTSETQCRFDRLKLMRVEDRKKYLRSIAPMTQDERRRIPMAPPVPAPPPPRHP